MINWERFHEYLPDSYGSMIPDVIDMFINSYDERIQIINTAIEQEDFPTLKKFAHDLKSNAGTFGGTNVYTLALQLEMMGANKVDYDMAGLFALMKPEADELLRELIEYRKTL